MEATGTLEKLTLSDEQEEFTKLGREGYNILVDACWGSGKTTAIQTLAHELALDPRNQGVLYLTYSRLLKDEARRRIGKTGDAFVQNYHGWALKMIGEAGLGFEVAQGDIIRAYMKHRDRIRESPKRALSTLIIDEYQDITDDYVAIIEDVVAANPHIQVVAVGDVDQKIYGPDDTDPKAFLRRLMEKTRPWPQEMGFTQSFRMAPALAEPFADIFRKKVTGRNEAGEAISMDEDDALAFLMEQRPEDVIILGYKRGGALTAINTLTERRPRTWTKENVYCTFERGSIAGASKDSAIVTTFDAAKGMERPIAVVYDYTDDYWELRSRMPGCSTLRLKNIFGVGATRGKAMTVFVRPDAQRQRGKSEHAGEFIDKEKLKEAPTRKPDLALLSETPAKDAIDYCYYEQDIEQGLKALDVRRLTEPGSPVDITLTDGAIPLDRAALAWCLASYFTHFDIDEAIADEIAERLCRKDRSRETAERFIARTARSFGAGPGEPLEQKALALARLQTGQSRYTEQAAPLFANPGCLTALHERLKKWLPRECRQVGEDYTLTLPLKKKVSLEGDSLGRIELSDTIDVIWRGEAWTLFLNSQISKANLVEAATAAFARRLEKAKVANLVTGELWQAKVKDARRFPKTLLQIVTKRYFTEEDLDEDAWAKRCAPKPWREGPDEIEETMPKIKVQWIRGGATRADAKKATRELMGSLA